MSFASPMFLWYFMPAVLGAYWLLPARARNWVIAVASLLFYAWGAGSFVLLLLGCMVLNFASGLAIDGGWLKARRRLRSALLVATVGADLSILVIWKYAGFGSTQLHHLFPDVPILHILLPIGISFFTFHHLSYVVDVYRGSRPAQRNPVQFVTYIAMFPQLIAGPIVRYHEISEQLAQSRAGQRLRDFADGFPRFALGLAKKVIIADSIAPIANAVFGAPVDQLDWRTAWIGALAYTIQIYFDFSGYSDMAIGLAAMFGFTLPENFNRPYAALSITDFWRRWHMSLSRWFRDYVYIPLGGNRGSSMATYRNLFTVFVLTGFWHGAQWTFLVWGLFHGGMLALERLTGLARIDATRWVAPRRILTLLAVIVGWVLFRADSLPHGLGILKIMAVPRFTGTSAVLIDAGIRNQALILLAFGLLVVFIPARFTMGRFLEDSRTRLAGAARLAYSVVAAPAAAILVAAGTFSPFLYFQF
ncbi:alginate O-acetyltransferase [Longispora fulva]|uniref:Alginate O-acetyltransferase complex protein AlgI n=1 Tax=Longispora fulva TaxID=619741 RepID=A0A8J7GJ03_9ACTN|nr:MBOAT family protein [Longispora fulva]MBG6137378.1 alginate O-acetyltransferase complex protein AlgI [Longispora fulva]GIG61268.1 alginate O-acetyltransferase [Longispora fulva]